MGRVLQLRNVALVSVLAVVALLLFAWSGARTAEAGHTFNPSFSTSLSPAGPGLHGDLGLTVSIPTGDANFESVQTFFIDKAWTIAPVGSSPSLGGIAGSLVSTATLGILNSACTVTTPVALDLIASSVPASGDDGSDRGPADTNWTGFFDGPDTPASPGEGSEAVSDGLPDYVTAYPKYMDNNYPRAAFATGGVDAISRLQGDTVVAGQPITVVLMIYPTNSLATYFGSQTPAQFTSGLDLGYPAVATLQNPAASDSPSSITDFCTPLSLDISISGEIADNPATTSTTESGIQLTNPAPGPYTMTIIQLSDRDDDGDGVEGDLDSCAGVANNEDPRVGFPVGDEDLDGIDSACDNVNVVTFDPAFEAFVASIPQLAGLIGLSTLPWSATSACRTGSGDDFLALDCDFDGMPNRQDNCPQMHDPTNADTSEILAIGAVSGVVAPLIALDGGPADDGIGNVCDADLTGSNGHFTEKVDTSTVTVLAVDSDGDGCFDFAEVLLGSDKDDANSTPENISPIPGGCPPAGVAADGLAENDPANLCDLAGATTDCGLPEKACGLDPFGVPLAVDDDGDGVVDDGCPLAGGVLTCIDTVDNDLDGATDRFDAACLNPFEPVHDIEISGLKGGTKVDRNETKGYSVRLSNNGPVTEVIPIAIAVLPISGCVRPDIDVNGDGVISPPGTPGFPPFGENLATDVNGDGVIDTLAFTASQPLKPGKQNVGVDFDVIYKDCPASTPPVPTTDVTSIDFVLLVDACHAGDDKALAPLFGGAPCGFAASDGGLDIFFTNDGPVTQFINNTDYLRIITP